MAEYTRLFIASLAEAFGEEEEEIIQQGWNINPKK